MRGVRARDVSSAMRLAIAALVAWYAAAATMHHRTHTLDLKNAAARHASPNTISVRAPEAPQARRKLQEGDLCSEPCFQGQGDCCDVIATSVLYAVTTADRVVRYDPVDDTFARFAEDRVNMTEIQGMETSKPWDAYPDDLLVLRSAQPSSSRVYDEVENSLELYDKSGQHVKRLLSFSASTVMDAMALGPNNTLFLGSYQSGTWMLTYSDRKVGYVDDKPIVLSNQLPVDEATTRVFVAPSAIVVTGDTTVGLTVYILYTAAFDCGYYNCLPWIFSDVGTMVPFVAIYDSATLTNLTDTGSSYVTGPPSFSEYITYPELKGLEILDSGDLVVSGRDQMTPLLRYKPGVGYSAFLTEPLPYVMDAWHVKKAPSGLLYVSDYTGFTTTVVVNQDGVLLGQLASTLGYNAGVQNIAFTRGAFATRCNYTDLPKFSRAGDEIAVDVVMQNAQGEFVDDELFVELFWQTISRSALTLITVDVSSTCVRQELGHYRCIFSPSQATLVYPMATNEDDVVDAELHVDEALLDFLDVEGANNLTDAQIEAFAVTLRVAVSSFRVTVASSETQSMFVSPSTPAATFSEILTSSLNLIAGESGQVDLRLRDQFGNDLASGGFDSNLKLVISSTVNGTYQDDNLLWQGQDHGSFASLQDKGNGIYVLEAALFTAGTALVQVLLDDTPAKNSPITIVSVAGMDKVSPTTTAVQGLGLESFDVDDWNSFALQARDEYGNNIAYSADIASTAPSSPVRSPMSIADYFLVHFTAGHAKYEVVGLWQQQKDGSFVVQYRVIIADNSNTGDLRFANERSFPETVEITVEYDGTVISSEASSVTAVARQKMVVKDYNQNSDLRAFGLAIAILGIAMVIAHIVYIVVHWKHKIMEFAQQRFLLVMCLGVICLFIFVCASYVSPSKETCTTGMWFSHLGFVLTIGSLTVKTWRVMVLAAHPEKLDEKARVQAVDSQAKWTMLAILFVTAVYLAVWTSQDPSRREEVTTGEEDSGGITTRYKADICSSSNVKFRVGLNVFELVLLATGAFLAYRTRDVHEAFAEAKWIGISLYNVIVVGGVGALMYTGFDMSQTQPDVAYAIVAVCMLVAAGGSVNFIMVPKIVAILRNEQVNFEDLKTSHEKIRSSPSKESSTGTRELISTVQLEPLARSSSGRSLTISKVVL